MRGVQSFLRRAAKRQDLALVTLLMMIIFMIILPLPTWLIDLLIAVNMAIVVLILIVTVYLKNPTSFSTLPAILLFSTLFRLAISISTTRLILVQADAGLIVETFGQFVVSGSLVVGIVVFLIITVVQFVVITKGSERIAEVSARFSLDALPGRQMSIDSDMRAGEIDMEEARKRRTGLQLESEFYGSMDGAMKFVKGDAIAGIIIIFVNIIGGIAIGVAQNGMSLSEAVDIYSVLTVGDGLVSQIPALFMAISSGVVITRITMENSSDLGTDIADQVSNNPRALKIAAVVLLVLALVPGFPTFTFLGLAILMGGLGFWTAFSVEPDDASDAQAPGQAMQDLALLPMAAVHLVLDDDLFASVNPKVFAKAAFAERSRLFESLGVPFPPIAQMRSNKPGEGWALRVEGVPVASGTIPKGAVRITDDAELLDILELETEVVTLTDRLRDTIWVDASAEPELKRNGIAFQGAEDALAMVAGSLLPRHAQEFLGVHEVSLILSSLEYRYDELVREAQQALPIHKIAQILRHLVQEDVPVRNMRIVLETIIQWASREKDADVLAEYVRVSLARQISYQYADSDRMIPAFVVEQDVEEAVRDAVVVSNTGSTLSLTAEQARLLIARVRGLIGNPGDHRSTPVLLVAMDVRRFLQRFLADHGVSCPVLSHREIAGQYRVQPLAMLTMK